MFVRCITYRLTVSPIRLLNFTVVAAQEDDELEGMYDPKGCGIIAFVVSGWGHSFGGFSSLAQLA